MITLHARRRDLEPHAAVLVVKRIEDKRDLVGSECAIVHELIAAGENGADSFLSHPVEHARSDVDRGIVIQNAYLGLLGRLLPLVGHCLRELADGSGKRPCGFLELPVDAYIAVAPRRLRHGPRIVLRFGGLLGDERSAHAGKGQR